MLKPKSRRANQNQQIEEITRKRKLFSLIGFIALLVILTFINNWLNYINFSSVKQVQYKGLTFKLTTDKDTYYQGEKVIITLVISNNSDRVVNLDFLTAELAYFTVYSYFDLGITGMYYKVWTTKPVIPSVPKVYKLVLRPKEVVKMVKTWDQTDMNGNPVKTGRYKFVAELNTVEKIYLRK
ncbi:MAG: hypothetical protein ABDH21_04000 [bacterium]